MKYTTIVDKDEQTLHMLIDHAEQFDRDRVLNGLQVRRYTIAQVHALTADVKEHNARLEKEIIALVQFSQDFNLQYATDNNACFDTAAKLFNKLRSSISGTKKMYRKFCPRTRRRGPVRDGIEQKPSVFSHSSLGVNHYMHTLFGTEGYDHSVQLLCQEMEHFFRTLVIGLKLCRDIMQQERDIRNDYKTVLVIYQNCCRQVIQETHGLMRYLEPTIATVTDDLTKKQDSGMTLQQIYHTVDKSQFQIHALANAINQGRRNGLTQTESLLWNNNRQLVTQVRLAIEHFDRLSPRGQHDNTTGKYKLSARYVAMFMKWCGITGSGKEKQFVQEYFNKTYHGTYQCISSSSVNSAKNHFTDTQYDTFSRQLTHIITTAPKPGDPVTTSRHTA